MQINERDYNVTQITGDCTATVYTILTQAPTTNENDSVENHITFYEYAILCDKCIFILLISETFDSQQTHINILFIGDMHKHSTQA